MRLYTCDHSQQPGWVGRGVVGVKARHRSSRMRPPTNPGAAFGMLYKTRTCHKYTWCMFRVGRHTKACFSAKCAAKAAIHHSCRVKAAAGYAGSVSHPYSRAPSHSPSSSTHPTTSSTPMSQIMIHSIRTLQQQATDSSRGTANAIHGQLLVYTAIALPSY